MPELHNFHVPGVSFPDLSREDINSLVKRVPNDGTLHLAILQPPYLDLIVDGTKTIESRFNTKRAAPFGKVAVGDLVLLKETGKPVTNYFFAGSALSLDLNEVPIGYVREQYGAAIQAQNEDAFWLAREASRYATLIGVGERGSIKPFTVVKRDQRGWVTFARDEPR